MIFKSCNMCCCYCYKDMLLILYYMYKIGLSINKTQTDL